MVTSFNSRKKKDEAIKWGVLTGGLFFIILLILGTPSRESLIVSLIVGGMIWIIFSNQYFYLCPNWKGGFPLL